MEAKCYYCNEKLNQDNEQELKNNPFDFPTDTFSAIQNISGQYGICKACYYNKYVSKASNSLKKGEILSLKKRISTTFEARNSITCFPLKVFYQVHQLEGEYPAQALFTAPKKNFKRAVDRNAIRRQMKEAYRNNKHFFYAFLNDKNIRVNLVFIYIHKQKVDSSEIEQQIIMALKKIIRKIENQSFQNDSNT